MKLAEKLPGDFQGRAGPDAAAQAGPAGGPQRAAQRHRDEDLRHRQRPGAAAFHRDARPAGTPRSRSASWPCKVLRDHAEGSAPPLRRLPAASRCPTAPLRRSPRTARFESYAERQRATDWQTHGRSALALSPVRSALSPRNPMSRDDQSVQGVLELHPKGYGFLRNPARNYAAQPADPYVPGPADPEARPARGPAARRARPRPAKKGSGPRLARVEHIEGAVAGEVSAAQLRRPDAHRSARADRPGNRARSR